MKNIERLNHMLIILKQLESESDTDIVSLLKRHSIHWLGECLRFQNDNKFFGSNCTTIHALGCAYGNIRILIELDPSNIEIYNELDKAIQSATSCERKHMDDKYVKYWAKRKSFN